MTERLDEEVRDAKIKVFGSLKLGTVEEFKEWKELSISLKVVFVTIPFILFFFLLQSFRGAEKAFTYLYALIVLTFIGGMILKLNFLHPIYNVPLLY